MPPKQKLADITGRHQNVVKHCLPNTDSNGETFKRDPASGNFAALACHNTIIQLSERCGSLHVCAKVQLKIFVCLHVRTCTSNEQSIAVLELDNRNNVFCSADATADPSVGVWEKLLFFSWLGVSRRCSSLAPAWLRRRRARARLLSQTPQWSCSHTPTEGSAKFRLKMVTNSMFHTTSQLSSIIFSTCHEIFEETCSNTYDLHEHIRGGPKIVLVMLGVLAFRSAPLPCCATKSAAGSRKRLTYHVGIDSVRFPTSPLS